MNGQPIATAVIHNGRIVALKDMNVPDAMKNNGPAELHPLYAVPFVPPGYVLMPAALTAENGAKGALSGEFFVQYTVECPDCEGSGIQEFDEGDCDCCNGSGELEESKTISWTTIKEIYAAAVECCAITTANDTGAKGE